MYIVNNREMEWLDQHAISRYSIPSSILTQEAGIQIGLKLFKIYPNLKNSIQNIYIFCGPGNNGADTLVLSRFLLQHGIKSQIFLFARKDQIKGNLKLNLTIIQKLSLTIIHIIPDYKNSSILNHISISPLTLLIDGIFGVGLKYSLEGFYKKLIEKINKLKDYHKKQLEIISIDIPSGMLNMEDQENSSFIHADHTLTIGLPKLAIMKYPGYYYAGKIHLIQIGFPKNLLKNKNFNKKLLTYSFIRSILPIRPRNSHKGTYGHLLIIAGSTKYIGAATLVSHAALRSGVGKITLISVSKACEIALKNTPEIIVMNYSENIIQKIKKNTISYDAIIFGPGIDKKKSHIPLLKEILNYFQKKPILIDADGLWVFKKILAKNSYSLKNNFIILTPHIKEMSDLLSLDKEKFIQNQFKKTLKFSEKNNCIVVLKSSITKIFHKNSIFFNILGNNGMATSGSGDVLCGIIGAFLSSKLEPIKSCNISVFIHALSGNFAKKDKDSFSLIASDIIKYLPKAFKKIQQG